MSDGHWKEPVTFCSGGVSLPEHQQPGRWTSEPTSVLTPPRRDLLAIGERTGSGTGAAVVSDPTASEIADRMLRGHLADDRTGFCVIRGLDQVARGLWLSTFWAIACALGNPMPQDADGTLVRVVADRKVGPGEGGYGRYSDSRMGGNLHTDGVPFPDPLPDHFGLLCVNPAADGGESIVVDVRDIVDRLRSVSPDAIAILTEVYHFDSRGVLGTDGPKTVARQIISISPSGTVHVSYLRPYIEAAHQRPEIPALREEQIAALSALDSVISDPSLQSRFTMQAGDMLFIDNRRLLHGRTTFTDPNEGSPARKLLRVWLSSR